MTGYLTMVGVKNYGWQKLKFWQCVDCKAEYPEIDGVVKCNGYEIKLCPWCRIDTKPWYQGRGI